MRRLTLGIAAVMLSALAASPALAAARHHARRHAAAAVARGYQRYYGHPYNSGSVNGTGPIYRQGYYLGSDPDPNIRFELIRDPWFARERP